MVTLQKIKNFSRDITIIGQLSHLTASSYIDNTAILEREIKHCNEIYLLYKDDDLVAFFMVNFKKLGMTDTYYLGLSCCHGNYKGNGFAKYLYNSFFIDCKVKESELKTGILYWWTTATPIPFKWFNENVLNCEPTLDGEVSKEGRAIFSLIAKEKYNHILMNASAPFILKNVAEKTCYSSTEREN